MDRLPVWLRQEISTSAVSRTARILAEFGLHTVCREAKCPNVNACFKNGQATFLILGDTCTRSCSFCSVKKAVMAFEVGVSRPQEPQLIAEAVKRLGLRYAVITSVTRDDLADGGAGIFAETIQEIRKSNRVIRIEALIPDFQGSEISLETVVKARPDVIGHNIETVKRLYCEVRPEADYQRSLGVLKTVKCLDSKITTKSSLMLGMGEVEAEVVKAMEDLRASDCDILTLGQYLPPSDKHYPVKDFIALEQFAKYKEAAMAMGFRVILSGPLVRSSYKAEEVYQTCMT